MSNARYFKVKACEWCEETRVALYTNTEVGALWMPDHNIKSEVKHIELFDRVDYLCFGCRDQLRQAITVAVDLCRKRLIPGAPK